MDELKMRNIEPQDHSRVISVVNDWWDGRDMTCMLPRLFFMHFQDTSFVAECSEMLVGFLIGFVSQSKPEEAYIHFAGIHPEYRKQGIAADLYNRFFNNVKNRGCRIARYITSPINKGSISFHQHMGFVIEAGEKEVERIPVTENYDGKGGDRVLFCKVFGS